MTDTITITAGRPNRQSGDLDFAGPDGTYPVTLVAISDPITEKSTQPLKGPKDDGMYTYRVWTLAIDDPSSEYNGQVIDRRANVNSTGPKSTQYGLVAAFAGAVPPIGAVIELPKLVGKQALALILTNENDYPYVSQVLAMPGQRKAQEPVAAPAPEPEPAPAATPLREAVAAGAAASNDLPWN